MSTLLIDSPRGKIPLAATGSLKKEREPGIITREGLNYTLNVYGYREKAAISHIMADFSRAMKGTILPPSVTMEQTGDEKEFQSAAGRMLRAIGFAVILIFLRWWPFLTVSRFP